jgi:hypothetical protein
MVNNGQLWVRNSSPLFFYASTLWGFTLANLTRNFRNPSKLRGTPTRPLDAVGGEGVCRVGEESHPRTTLTAL